jgi:hypothetical protein
MFDMAAEAAKRAAAERADAARRKREQRQRQRQAERPWLTSETIDRRVLDAVAILVKFKDPAAAKILALAAADFPAPDVAVDAIRRRFRARRVKLGQRKA